MLIACKGSRQANKLTWPSPAFPCSPYSTIHTHTNTHILNNKSSIYYNVPSVLQIIFTAALSTLTQINLTTNNTHSKLSTTTDKYLARVDFCQFSKALILITGRNLSAYKEPIRLMCKNKSNFLIIVMLTGPTFDLIIMNCNLNERNVLTCS